MRAHSDLFGQTQADNRGALWVPIIEKAYVAAGYLATSMERTGMLAVANTEGANMDFVYGHVRGREGRRHRHRGGREAGAGRAPDQEILARYRGVVGQDVGLALQDRKVVVLETVAQIAKGPLGVGHSGGEPKAKGLVGSHAYTAIATASEGDRLFIRVRNPWGNYGRAYDWGAAKGGVAKVNKDAGEFLIELNDAVERFAKVMDQRHVTITKPVRRVAARGCHSRDDDAERRRELDSAEVDVITAPSQHCVPPPKCKST